MNHFSPFHFQIHNVYGRLCYKDEVLYITDNICKLSQYSLYEHDEMHFRIHCSNIFTKNYVSIAAVIKIGRNSSTSTVHFHVGKNSFVSRKHLQVTFDRNSNGFYLMCLSKNGVFVNDVFQRKSSEPLKLPKTYVFKFTEKFKTNHMFMMNRKLYIYKQMHVFNLNLQMYVSFSEYQYSHIIRELHRSSV